MNESLLQIILGIALLTVVFINISKKNSETIIAYGIQSLAIVFILLNLYLETKEVGILIIVILVLLIKVVASILFFNKLIHRHELRFTIRTYCNVPLTFTIVAFLILLAYSSKFIVLTSLIPANQSLISASLAFLFISLFLIVNSKGALSQIFGVLSLDNSIVALAVFTGLEQSLSVQVGILFDLFVWMTIAVIFVSMIYRHLGSLDVTSMKNLTE